MQATTQQVIADVNAENCMDRAISSQAVRATGGRFNDQVTRTTASSPSVGVDLVAYEDPRVPGYPNVSCMRGNAPHRVLLVRTVQWVEDMIWATGRPVEAGVKLPGDNTTKVIKTSQRGRDVKTTYDVDQNWVHKAA